MRRASWFNQIMFYEAVLWFAGDPDLVWQWDLQALGGRIEEASHTSLTFMKHTTHNTLLKVEAQLREKKRAVEARKQQTKPVCVRVFGVGARLCCCRLFWPWIFNHGQMCGWTLTGKCCRRFGANYWITWALNRLLETILHLFYNMNPHPEQMRPLIIKNTIRLMW